MRNDDMSHLRTVRLVPYRKGCGPVFTLKMRDTGRRDWRGQTLIGYELRGTGLGVIFAGEDFAGSPMHADDSDECVASLMTFLTLRPGDTDAEYFAGYTDAQRAFCDAHAEALSFVVSQRFDRV